MTAHGVRRPGRAILGGSFTPPHVGHLRLAVEAREALGDLVRGVDMVPCARPPHKKTGHLLPFELRAAMLEAALAPLPWLRCNRLEALRDGPPCDAGIVLPVELVERESTRRLPCQTL